MKLDLSLAQVSFLRHVMVGMATRLEETQLALGVLRALEAAGPTTTPHTERLTQGMSEAGRMAEHHRAVDTLMASPKRLRAPWPDFNGEPIHAGDTIEHPDGSRGVVIRMRGQFRYEEDRWRVRYDGESGPGGLSRLVLQITGKGRAVVVKA
jgi:hypothetical protein